MDAGINWINAQRHKMKWECAVKDKRKNEITKVRKDASHSRALRSVEDSFDTTLKK